MEVCAAIFEDYICKCVDEFTVHANVPEGPYIAQVVTAMGKVYETNVVADAAGSFVIPASIFPDGLLNEYAGGFQVFLFLDACTPQVMNLAHPGETVTAEYDYAFFSVKGGNCAKDTIGCVLAAGPSLMSAIDIDIPKFQDMGATLKVQTFPLYEALMSAELSSDTILLAAIQVLQAGEFTGIVWINDVPGDYTPANFNGAGLYKHMGGGIIELVATMADVPTAFTGGPGFVDFGFTAAYTADAGLYFIAMLYGASAAVVVPAVAIHSTFGDIDAFAGLFTDGMKVCGTIPGTSLPASIDMADVTAANTLAWAGLY